VHNRGEFMVLPSGVNKSTGVRVALEELGRNGGCALLKVELERQPGEETPRVTVRGAQRLDALLEKSRGSDLSDEEKRELTALMTARPRSG
jgi:DNA polymerase-3 subunit alpha